VQKGLLGVSGNALNTNIAEKFEIDDTQGFLIGEVIEGMGAEEAGLKKGDIIKKVDDAIINSFSDLTGYLSTKRPGQKVKLNFTRSGVNQNLMVNLKKKNVTQFIGMEVKNLSKDEKAIYNIENGVIIKDLYNSRLYRYGIEEGYILLEINNNKVNDIADVDSVTLSSLSSMLFLKPDGEKERIVFE
jgi:S1-C subfamily serine protease